MTGIVYKIKVLSTLNILSFATEYNQYKLMLLNYVDLLRLPLK